MKELIRSFVTFVLLSGFIFSCTETTDEEGGKRAVVEPGIYSGEIVFTAEVGKKNENLSRGFNEGNGEFTNTYPYKVIYIHSADNKEIGEGHQVLEVPLDHIEECGGDCQGIRFDMEVRDDGSYVLTKDGIPITLQDDEKVYFSSLPTPYWEAEVEPDKTPLNQRDLFVESDANDQELLRSEEFDAAALRDLLYTTTPEIVLTRSTSAFRVYFEFTNIPSGDDNDETISASIDEEIWQMMLGAPVGNFYIKLYMGPNFCHRFDMYNRSVVDGDEGGYYATNSERYQKFESVRYGTTGGSDEQSPSYIGFGYQSDDNKYLFSPVNLTLNESFCFYAFIKYSAEEHSDPNDDFWTSDEGAKYFQVTANRVSLTPNTSNYIIMAFDYMDLKIFVDEANGTTTTDSYVRNAWSGNGPEKIDIKPIKIIYQ